MRSVFRTNSYAVREFFEESWSKSTKFLIVSFLIIFSFIHLSLYFTTSLSLNLFPIRIDQQTFENDRKKKIYRTEIFIIQLIKTLFMPFIGSLLDTEHITYYQIERKKIHQLVLKHPFHLRICKQFLHHSNHLFQ